MCAERKKLPERLLLFLNRNLKPFHSPQLGGQKKEREKYLRGLKQAAVERSQMCLEARQVLSVAREWMSEHRESAMELRQLKMERE